MTRVDSRTDDTAILARTAEGEVRLLGRIAAGDRHAFEALYRAYFPRLARFLNRMTRNSLLIEEIVNDTLLVVWQKAARFDGSSKASTPTLMSAQVRTKSARNGSSNGCAWPRRSMRPSPRCRWRKEWPSS
jgi:hypothetical protein